MDNKLKIGVGIGVAAIIAAGGGYLYFNSNEHIPEYAVQIAEQAVTNHDKKYFYKVVDVDSVLNNSYIEIVEGLTDSDKTMPPEAKDAVRNFTQLLKAPLLTSLKATLDSYIETGSFDRNIGVNELLARAGIDRIEYRGFDGVTINPDNENVALAKIRIYQPELGQDFVFEAVLNRDSNSGDWKIVRIANFQTFIDRINQIRNSQLSTYLERASEINARHDGTIREAEQKYTSILALGSIGQENIRSDLRTLMLDVVKKDWEVRKQELFSLNVPRGAELLQSVWLKICDLEIGYAEDYAQWMEDKKSATIKSAEEKQRQSQELKTEATSLVRRLTND